MTLSSRAVLAACLLIAAPAVAQTAAAPAGKVCLRQNDIVSSKASNDGSSILFQMRDGKSWRNDLQAKCPDLRYNGFTWLLHGPDTICDNQQTIKVIQSDQVCQLGKFTAVTSDPNTVGTNR